MTAPPPAPGSTDPDPVGRSPRDWLPLLRDVRESGDRRATLALLTLLGVGGSAPYDGGAGHDDAEELDEDTLEDITDTLCVLEDPRSERPLEALLLDLARARDVREAALRVLSCLPCDDPPPLRVAAWLDDADGLVRAHAASFLGPRDEERLVALVHDPVVEVRRSAAEALVGATRTPGLVQALHHALRDPDPLVREIACRAALFDEPVAATYDLLHLLDDEDGDVRCGVYDALEDYPCVSVLLALTDACSGQDGGLAAATLEVLVARVGVALGAASDAGVRRILRWAAPVRWLLEEEWEGARDDLREAVSIHAAIAGGRARDAELDDDVEEMHGSATAERPPVNVVEAEYVLSDDNAPGTRQRDLLVSRDWGGAGNRGLAVLVESARSRLWSVRHGVAVALLDLVRSGAPGAADELLRLTEDVEPVVRRIAIHALTHAADPRVVQAALATLADDRARSIAGDAALQAIAHLAPGRVAERAILDELGGGHDRDGVRLGAVHLAERLRIQGAVPLLAAVAAAEVVSGPAVHVAALRALRSLNAPASIIDLAHLEGLDHLDVQAELGAWDWHGPRYG